MISVLPVLALNAIRLLQRVVQATEIIGDCGGEALKKLIVALTTSVTYPAVNLFKLFSLLILNSQILCLRWTEADKVFPQTKWKNKFKVKLSFNYQHRCLCWSVQARDIQKLNLAWERVRGWSCVCDYS